MKNTVTRWDVVRYGTHYFAIFTNNIVSLDGSVVLKFPRGKVVIHFFSRSILLRSAQMNKRMEKKRQLWRILLSWGDIRTRTHIFSLSDSHNKPSKSDRHLYRGRLSFSLGAMGCFPKKAPQEQYSISTENQTGGCYNDELFFRFFRLVHFFL